MLLKTKFFEQKGNLSSGKEILACFSRPTEHDICQGTVIKGPEDLFDIYCASYKFISKRHKRSLEKHFKNGYLQLTKILAYFFS